VVDGGNGPSFAWTFNGNPFSTDQSLFNLDNGVYVLQYTDNIGCFVSTFTVNVGNFDTPIISDPGYIENAGGSPSTLCSYSYDGVVDATITGGVLPFTYTWSINGSPIGPAQTTVMSTDPYIVRYAGVGLGDFELYVTDVNGCTSMVPIEITESMLPPEILLSINSSTNVGCNADPSLSSTIDFVTNYSAIYDPQSSLTLIDYALYEGVWDPTIYLPSQLENPIWTSLNIAAGVPTSSISLNNGPDACNVYTMVAFNKVNPWDPSYNWPETENWALNCKDVEYIAVGDIIDLKLDRIVSPFCSGQNGLGSIYVNVDVSCNEAQTYAWVDTANPTVVISTSQDLINVPPAEYELTVTYGPCAETLVYDLGITHILDGDPIWDSGSSTDGVITIDPIGNTLVTTGQNLIFGRELEIPAGQTWDISNSNISFTDEIGLRVLSNANFPGELVGQNTSFTSACSAYWDGIQVTALLSGAILQQSTLLLNNCRLSYAYNAVRNHHDNALNDNSEVSTFLSGGNISLFDVAFHNNRRDIYLKGTQNNSLFNDYQPTVIRGSSLLDYEFFEIALYERPQERIYVTGFQRGSILIDGMSFTNERVDFLSIVSSGISPAVVLTALRVDNTPFVFQDTDDLAVVSGFTRGLRTTMNQTYSLGSGTNTVIDGIEFECYRGIFGDGSLNNTLSLNNTRHIYNCTFQNLPFSINQVPVLSATGDLSSWTPTNIGAAAYGCYMNMRYLWDVQNNTFNMLPKITGNQENTVGFIANRCREANILRNNIFTGNKFGAGFYGQNRYVDNNNITLGLQYTCNKFPGFESGLDGNTFDIVLVQGQGTSPYGVPQQGALSTSAANEFTQNTLGSDTDDINDGTPGTHVYFRIPGSTIENLDETNVIELNATGQIDCQIVEDPFMSMVQGSGEAMLISSTNEYNNKRAEYLSIVDGGNTDALTDEVIYTTFNEALELYYNLMGKSPNLSEEVLIEIINKEASIPNVLVKQILASNPQAAKNIEVMDRVENKLIPFDEYQKAEIMEGLEWVSTKERLESEMTSLLYNREIALQRIAEEIMLNESIEDKSEAYLLYLNTNEFRNDAIKMAEVLIGNGDIGGAVETISGIISSFDMKADAESELVDWLAVLEIQSYLESTGSTSLTYTDYSSLENYFLNSGSIPATYAYNLLLKYSDFEYEEPIYEYAVDANIRNEQISANTAALFTLLPNPFGSFIVIDSRYSGVAEIEIVDLTGRIVLEENLRDSEFQKIIDLAFLSPGTYILSIQSLSQQLLFSSPIIKL
jgi:hypothetical protein